MRDVSREPDRAGGVAVGPIYTSEGEGYHGRLHTPRPFVSPPVCPSRPSVHPSRPHFSPPGQPIVRPSLRLCVRPSLRPSLSQFVRLSVRPSLRSSVSPTVSPSAPSFQHSIRPSIPLSVSLSVHLSVRPSLHPSICFGRLIVNYGATSAAGGRRVSSRGRVTGSPARPPARPSGRPPHETSTSMSVCCRSGVCHARTPSDEGFRHGRVPPDRISHGRAASRLIFDRARSSRSHIMADASMPEYNAFGRTCISYVSRFFFLIPVLPSRSIGRSLVSRPVGVSRRSVGRSKGQPGCFGLSVFRPVDITAADRYYSQGRT